MVFYAQVDITDNVTGSVTSISDAYSIQAARTLTDTAGTFTLRVPNDVGKYSGTFSVGDSVDIYLDSSYPPTGNQIFNGNITAQEFIAQNNNREFIRLDGMDCSQNLKDVSAVNVYSNLPAGSIIKSLISEYVSGVSVSGVQDGATIAHIGFNRRPIFDCIKQLALDASYDFYVDNSGDLHFEPGGTVSSGKNVTSGNCSSADFRIDKRDMYNSIYVYGGRRTVAYQDPFTADGVGSVYTLTYKPANPYVTLNGAVQNGWIKELSAVAPAGVDYLHDYDNKQVIFLTPPALNDAIIAQYGRKIPVVKLAEDRPSIEAYGRRQKVIANEEIQDPRHARLLAVSELTQWKDPAQYGTYRLIGETSFTPGQLVTVNFPYHNINNENQKIVGVQYNVTPETLRTEETTTLLTSQRISDTSDILRDILSRLRDLEAGKIDPSDIITRIELAAGSIGIRCSYWYVRSRNIGSSLLANHPINGIIGSVGAGSLQPLVGWWGDASWTVQISGGTFT